MKVSLKLKASVVLFCIFSLVCSEKKQVVKRTEALYNIYNGIGRILSSGKKVSLYIHMRISKNMCGNRKTGVMGEKQSGETEAENFSQLLLNRFSGQAGFSLVDRGQLPALVKEIELKQTGLLSEENRSKIGRLLSVNYIIEMRFAESCVKNDITETSRFKLIELETGRVISVDIFEVFKHYNDTMENWETDRIKLNRKEVIFDESKLKYYY